MANLINRNWAFGQNAGLNFSTSPPTAVAGSPLVAGEGCASISNAGGSLVLTTNGNMVWDAQGNVRASNLQGNQSSTQSAIIVPDPASATRYYVFTADGTTGGNNHVNGIRIDTDTSTSTSTWPVTALSALMTMPNTSGFSSTEKLTAIQHANCRDFWVLTVIQRLKQGQDQTVSGPGVLRVFLVDGSGVQHVSDTPMGVNVNDVGYLKGSSDGRRIALANWYDQNVLVYPFNSATGTIDLSKLLTVQVPPIPNHGRQAYGVEFSPNSDILYYSVLGGTSIGPGNEGYVFQKDLLSASPSLPLGTPHPNGGPPFQPGYALGALQLGMDGRIYIAQDQESRLGVIANPNVLGSGCNLAFSAVALAPNTVCRLGLPNLIPNACDCPCSEGNCDDAVRRANRILNTRASQKSFTVPANGQTPPQGCAMAFEQTAFPPLFTLHWGDGPTDQFESHDTEIVYIRVRNPYRNMAWRGLKIFNIRITPNQVLPDGENALQLIPAEIVCFDEVGPCSFVSRDFAFLIQNAVVKGYQITFDYCIEETVIVGGGKGRVAFGINVVAS
jgi:hypothetical protein